MSNAAIEAPSECDVLVIGGGAAGLSAALVLGRARRSVIVVDAGEPRNAPAEHMHAYLGFDGVAPQEFLAVGRQEVGRYGVELRDGRVRDVGGDAQQGFHATLADGTVVRARRVLLASGLVDVLPDIPGVKEQWGRAVVHCPYCHGWEVRDRRLVVIATSEAGSHQAELFRQLSGQVSLVVHDPSGAPDAETRARLAARGVPIVDGPVAEVVNDGTDVTGVRLADATVLPADAVVVAPRYVARAEAVASLGLTTVPGPGGLGETIKADGSGATDVAGVYAAGNVADMRAQVLHAASEGSRAAAAINADLVADDAAIAIRTTGG